MVENRIDSIIWGLNWVQGYLDLQQHVELWPFGQSWGFGD